MPETSFESKSENAAQVTALGDSNVGSQVSQTKAEPSVSGSNNGARYQPTENKNEIGRWIISAIILAIGFGILFGLGALREDPKDQPKDQLIVSVSTTHPTPFAGQLDMVVSGTVVPYREIRVAAEVSGNVIKKYPACEAGNFVRKGEKLLEIDPEDYKLQLETRRAELQQSERMLDETKQEIDGAKKNVELAERDYKLALTEFERNKRIKNALSSAEFDQSKRNLLNIESALTNRRNNLNLINARLERMQSAISLAKAQLKRAELNLSKSTIVAPDDGIIVSESIQEGEFVNLGKELLTFEDTSRSEVICNLSPRDLEWIRNNSPVDPEAAKKIAENKMLAVYYLPKTAVSIFEPKKESVKWEGMLERFDGIGRDNRTRTIPTRITIAQPIVETDGKPHALVRGMYVKCQIEVPVSEGSSNQRYICFPEIALQPEGFVWTVDDKMRLRRVEVDVVDRGTRTIENTTEKYVVIKLDENTLSPSHQVVTSPIPTPVEGMEVRFAGDEPAGDSKSTDDSNGEDSGKKENQAANGQSENAADTEGTQTPAAATDAQR